MRYAIRLSRLPSLVVYVTINSPPDEMIDDLEDCYRDNGPFKAVHRILSWFEAYDHTVVEDETNIVFTDTRDADYLICKTNRGFTLEKCV